MDSDGSNRRARRPESNGALSLIFGEAISESPRAFACGLCSAGFMTYFDNPPDNSGADPDYPRESVFARGVLRNFVNDYTKLEAEAGVAFGKFRGGDTDYYLVNWALEAERALMNGIPASVFLRYEGFYADDVGENDYSLDTTILVGMSTSFGGASENPYINNKYGVSLNLPDIGRWGGILNGPIE